MTAPTPKQRVLRELPKVDVFRPDEGLELIQDWFETLDQLKQAPLQPQPGGMQQRG